MTVVAFPARVLNDVQYATVWVAPTPADLPTTGPAQKDVGLCLNGFIYHYDVNTSGWTLKFDPADTIGEITGLTDALAGKSNLGHTHPESDIVNLSTDLAGKAALVHTHAAADVVSGTFDPARLGSGSGGATKFLREDSTFQTVSAATAWGGITGTLATQTDLQAALTGKQPVDSDLTTIAGLTATTDNVLQSVASAWASRTPAQLKTSMAFVAADVGLGSVDNTSDASKPVSTAQQTALDLKAPLASPTLTGTPLAPTAAVGTNTTQLATTAYVRAVPLDTLTAPTDIATLNASTSTHGLLRKLDGLSTTFLRGDGTWATPTATATLGVALTPAANESLAANLSHVVVRSYTIATGKITAVATGARLRIL